MAKHMHSLSSAKITLYYSETGVLNNVLML